MFNFKNALKLAAVAGLVAVSTTSFAAGKMKLVVGTEAGYAPYEYLDKSGKIVGFDMDLIHQVCTMINADCVVKDMAFDTLIPSVKAKKVDMVIAGVNPTDARRRVVAFTNSYLSDFKYVYMTNKNSSLSNPTAAKKVGFQAGTVAQQYLQTKTSQTPVPYSTFDLAFTDLKAHRIDAILLSLDTANEWVKNPQYKFIGQPFYDKKIFGEGPAILVNKSNHDLLGKLNGAINTLKSNGFIHKLQVKYNLQLEKK